jgi:hypothetical protein
MMVYFLSDEFPLYIINEYPKSGGTWVGNMFARAMNIPFPINRFPAFGASVMHGHYLQPRGMKNVIIVYRDGRDVMVSWYHHCLLHGEYGNNRLVNKTRKSVSFKDYENIRRNMPEFIEYAFTRQKQPGFSYSDFIKFWHNRNDVVYVRYEDLKNNTIKELRRIVFERSGKQLLANEAKNIVEEFSFSRMTGRKPGEENKTSFFRKGVVGDWRNYFCQRAKKVFDFYAGTYLIKLGYEESHTWTNEE